MILVLGSVVVRDGHLDEALELSQGHVRRSRSEPGCLRHGVHRDTENPQRLVFVEIWEDGAAITRHFEVAESIAFVRALTSLCAEPPEIEVFDAEPVSV